MLLSVKNKNIVRNGIFFAVLVFLPRVIFAASLNPTPETISVTVGSSTTISIVLGTDGQSANAVSGSLSYPKNLVSVTSISKAGSIINFWAQEPTFSNSTGVVSFEGVVLNPGYTGQNGKVLKITFQAKSAGSGTLKIANASVLANDGQGTNILSSLGQATIISTAKDTVPASPVVTPTTSSALAAPVVISSTHPDPTKWYALRDIHVTWDIPSEVTTIYAGINQKTDTMPVIAAKGRKDFFDLHNARDGVWYAHVKFSGSEGVSPVTHFKMGVDATPPESFTAVSKSGDDTFRTYLEVAATDATSGIAGYEFTIDTGEPIRWVDDGSHIFTSPALKEGAHTISAKAFDRAGNSLGATAVSTTGPIPAPHITEYPQKAGLHSNITIKGTSIPGSEVSVVLSAPDSLDPIIVKATADTKGAFEAVFENISTTGSYTAKARTTIDGIQSAYSKSVVIDISSGVWKQAVGLLMAYWWILAILVGLIILYKLLRLLLGYRRKEQGSVPEIGSRVIAHAIAAELAILEKIKRGEQFSVEERHFLSQLRRDLGFIDQTGNVGDSARDSRDPMIAKYPLSVKK